MNIWQSLPKPIFALAPMEEVTDTVFRRIIQKAGGKNSKLNLTFTEFTSCEGLQSVGFNKVSHRLKYHKSENTNKIPLIAQIWGITPQDYYKSAKMIKQMGFAGIDINMGCPVKKVIKMGACSALIKNPSLAKEIVQAVREAEPQLPLSIKTRIGFNIIETEKWCMFLLNECRPDALTIHGRTVKEESKVPCHWDEIGLVVKIKNQLSPKTIIIGNGDVLSLTQAEQKIAEFGVDGVMIGRGVFQNPWLFNPNLKPENISPIKKLKLLKLNVKMFEKEWNKNNANLKNYQTLKRFFKIYINGFVGSAGIRAKLMQTNSYEQFWEEFEQIIANFKA
jgi:tRNA-dihydrouridine synthase